MFGSVLCSPGPGCFSLYRCQAVRDVLPTYATKVNHAFEFLTKDMGRLTRYICSIAELRNIYLSKISPKVFSRVEETIINECSKWPFIVS